jgi:hypothetical protein
MGSKSRKPVGTEEDIMTELDGEPLDPDDPESPIMIDEDKAREMGALDAESVRINRQSKEVVERKIANEKSVPFAEINPLLKYEQVIKTYGLEGISIIVTRLDRQTTETIHTKPKTAQELYTILMALHGRREQTTYDLIFYDSTNQMRRGKSRITLQSTIEETPPQVQPMNPHYPFNGYPPQPGYAQQPLPVPPPPQQPTPPGLDVAGIMAMQKQMMDMVLAMQRGQPIPPPSVQPLPMQPISVPQASPPQGGLDVAGIMAMQKQMMDMILAMQGQHHQPVQQPPPPVQPPLVQQSQSPDIMTMMMAMQKQTLEMVLAMQRAASPPARESTPYRDPAPYRGPAYGPRPSPRYTEEDPDVPAYGPRSAYGGPPAYGAPPPKPKTAHEEMRDAVSLLNMVTKMSDELRGPQQQQQPEYAGVSDDEDDNPVRVVETGKAKIVFDKKTGSARAFETLWANLPELTKFAGEQFNNLQKNAVAAQQQKQQQRQQLPPGYVELTPGYQPPPGMVAVPVDHVPGVSGGEQFPEPPANLPPPISSDEMPKPAWKNPFGGSQP